MSVWHVIRENMWSVHRIHCFSDRPETPARFCGLLKHDASECTACTACAYVCSPGAITVTDEGDGAIWEFDPGRCTFCGRCLDICVPRALTMENKCAESHTVIGGNSQMSEVKYPACEDCGKRIRPLSKKVLEKVPEELRGAVEEGGHLCEDCRRRRFQKKMASPGGVVKE